LEDRLKRLEEEEAAGKLQMEEEGGREGGREGRREGGEGEGGEEREREAVLRDMLMPALGGGDIALIEP
jgi:hypothetical protein